MQNVPSWSTTQLLPCLPLRRAFPFIPLNSLCSSNYSLPWIIVWVQAPASSGQRFSDWDGWLCSGGNKQGDLQPTYCLDDWTPDRCRQSNIHNCHCALFWKQNLDAEVYSSRFQNYWRVDHGQENLWWCRGGSLEVSGWNKDTFVFDTIGIAGTKGNMRSWKNISATDHNLH